jgi:hypothetical protein
MQLSNIVRATLLCLVTGAGCHSGGGGGAGNDAGSTPDPFADAATTPDGAGGTSTDCSLNVTGDFTATYACTATSAVSFEGAWILRIDPTDAPGNVTLSISVQMAGTVIPSPGNYSFDSPSVDPTSTAGLTVLGTPVQSWSATPGTGSLALTLAAIGPPHGSLTATLPGEASGSTTVMLAATF